MISVSPAPTVQYRRIPFRARQIEMRYCTSFVLVACSLTLILVDRTAVVGSTNKAADQCCAKVDTETRQIIDVAGIKLLF